MSYKRKTLRKMKPLTKKVATAINELERIKRKLTNLLPEIQEAEIWQQAESNKRKARSNGQAGMYCPTCRQIVITSSLKCPACGDMVQDVAVLGKN